MRERQLTHANRAGTESAGRCAPTTGQLRTPVQDDTEPVRVGRSREHEMLETISYGPRRVPIVRATEMAGIIRAVREVAEHEGRNAKSIAAE